jgi:membrane fusion protein (multidrug efflux system)
MMSLEDAEQRRRLADRRKRWFTVLAGVLVVGAVGAAIWWLFVASRYVSTDNAYVGVSTAQVTPLTSGTALDVRVANAQTVRKGDVLLVIDPADARLAYEQAEAAYGLTLRKVEGYYAALDARRADAERTKLDYERRLKIKATAAVSGEELAAVKNAYEGAQAALRAAAALTHDTSVKNHPEVLAAKAVRDTAKLNLDRTIVRAPVDGIIAQRSVQVGQRVQAGSPVMAVVPIQAVYVDANFKEDQLAKVRPGQLVELTSDLYGSDITFHGRVIGLGGGTGSAFAIIPAQNATGNWIKVVQRIPVRIALDPAELRQHPLRVGLSMTATIDISK